MNKTNKKDSPNWILYALEANIACKECALPLLAGAQVLKNFNGDMVCLNHAILNYKPSFGKEAYSDAIEEETDHIISKIIGKKHSRFMEFVLLCSLFGVMGMIIFLSIDLPTSYTTKNWDTAWVGFDFGLLVTLALTLWAIWKERQIAIISSAICGSILIIDSWFDVATSNGGRDLYSALATAAFLQIPFALVLFRFSRNVMHRSLEDSYEKVGMIAPKISFFKTPLKIPTKN